MMHLDIRVDLAKYAQGRLSVRVAVRAGRGEHAFALAALAAGPGVSVLDWQVAGAESRAEGQMVSVTGGDFVIRYDVEILHKVCLGSGKDTDLVYPFINENEVFFGTGLLPVPRETCTAEFRLAGLPPGWSEYSSLTPGGMHSDKLSAFFCYCAPAAAPAEHAWRGRAREVKFRILKQRGILLPVPEQALFDFFDGYMTWLEASLAPYQRAGEINYLVLQAPADFSALTGGRSFATGENVLNGIACYSPNDAGYLKNYFGYSSYEQYLYEGLAHELTHFYTSAAPEAREKSVLYAAPGCPAYAARLLGEALNNYFYSGYVARQAPAARGAFENWLSRAKARAAKTGARQPFLDLLELDEYLRANGASLLRLFREMVLLKVNDRTPYSSAAFLFETMRGKLRLEPPAALEAAILSEP